MMSLLVPLSEQQIHSANKVYDRLVQWKTTDTALQSLAQRFPEFDLVPTLLKVVAVNALYGTNVYALMRMAEHAQRVITGTNLAAAGPELVESLAALPVGRPEHRKRTHLSFASKFAHFFIDPERFPILDSYAVKMLYHHLGRPRSGAQVSPYHSFCRELGRLKNLCGWKGTYRDLDHYLWIAGQHRTWQNNPKVPINAELRTLFEKPSESALEELANLG